MVRHMRDHPWSEDGYGDDYNDENLRDAVEKGVFSRLQEWLEVFSASGDLSNVQELIANGANINFKNRYGKTPLFMACWNNRLEVATFLIEKGAEVNVKDRRHGWSPLMVSSKLGHAKICKLLIDNGADPDTKNNKGESPFYIACRLEYSEVAKLLFESGADVQQAKEIDHDGCSLLHHIADRDLVELAKLLIENDIVDVHGKTIKDGETALHISCKSGRSKMVQLLVRYADLNAKNNAGKTPLHVPYSWPYVSYSRPIIKLLLEHGADPNVKDNDGTILLHSLCKDLYNQLESIELLIENGTDINTIDNDGKTPLYYACENGNLQMVQLLVSRGANVHATTRTQGSTPLHVASERCHWDIVCFLLRNGADANVEDDEGIAPLHVIAERNNDLEVVWYLVRQYPLMVFGELLIK